MARVFARHDSQLCSLSSRRSREQWSLLVDRYSQGLLAPFSCSRCGVIALDPLGWNGPRQPLCERCADPEEVPL